MNGSTPAPFDSFQVFGDGQAIGNTLMANPPPNLNVNTVLLPSSSANLSAIPADANPQAVYLWWSGSLAPGEGMADIDDDAVFTAADGATTTVVADDCDFIVSFGGGGLGFFYCRADVTAFVTAHPGMFSWNGTYTVGSVDAAPGQTVGMGCAAVDPQCQAHYAAWSMIFVYDSPSATLQRDVIIYDGFIHADETNTSLGIASFSMSGFLVGTPAEVELTYFGMEGDAHLGAGPGGHCATCPDFFSVNGVNLSDGFNPAGNVYNSSDALGLDIDQFEIGTAGGGLGILDTGATSAMISTGTGDNVINPGETGESIFLGWVFLRLNRPSPNFRGPSTAKFADRASAATGETVTYTVNVANQGSLTATNTTFTDSIPSGMTYQANSISIDGVGCTDASDGDPCTFSGGTITVSLGTVGFTGDNDRLISFRATVSASGVGTTVCNVGAITSTQTPTPSEVGPACTTVATASLGQATKSGLDLTGGVTGPDDVYQYTVTIPGDPSAPTSGITFTDDMPQHVQLLSYTSPGGTAMDASTLTGGTNGNGRVRFTNISIPAGGSATITITVQVDSEAEFVAGGIPSASIHGQTSCNQGQVEAGFLPGPLLTDNPATAGAADATCFTVTYAPVFATSFKGAVDDDGAPLEPGDTITYTISLSNTGNRQGTISLDDSMPAEVENFVLLTPLIGATFQPPPAGTNGTGRFLVSGLVVAPGTTSTIQFRVTVQDDAVDGATVVNQAIMTVAERAEENRTLISPSFTIFARPDLSGLTKTVTDLNGGSVEPGDLLSYGFSVTNTGNRPATSLAMTDVVPSTLTDVTVTGGSGTFDAATSTITWTQASLAVGATFTASFTARVVTPLANGTTIANQSSIDSVEPSPGALSDDPSTAAVDDPTVVTVVSAPNLSGATKTVVDLNGGDARPGDALEWTISFTNTGSANATNVVVTDVVDADLENVVPLDGGTLTGSTITWNLGAVASGATRTVRFTSSIRTPLLDGTVISNQGSLTTPELAAPVLTDDPATPAADDPTILVVESAADLSESFIDFVDLNGGAAQPGDQIRYTVTIINSGDSPATGLTASVVVDALFATVVAEDGGTFNAVTRTVTWNLPGTLNPGDTPIEVSFVATLQPGIPNGTVICHDAVVDSAEAPPFTTAEVCLTVESRPDFAATTKTVVDVNGGAVRPGDVLLYTITVTNEGTQDGTAVVVSDVVDGNLTAIAPLDGGVFAGGAITWNIASVAAGASTTVRFNATVVSPLDDGTEIPNQATVMCGNGCPAPEPSDDPTTVADDDPTIVTVEADPGLTVTKSFADDDGGILDPGDAITYTIVVTNDGDACADEVVVTDLIDTDLGGVVAEQGGTFDGTTVTWNGATTPGLDRVCPGGPVTLILHAVVDNPIPDTTPVCNQTQTTSEEQTVAVLSDDPTTPAPGDQTCRPVVSGALVTGATKTVLDLDGGDVRPGDTLRYTITFTNEGNANAVNVTVTDPLDPSIAAAFPANGGAVVGGQVVWGPLGTPELAVVNVGETVTLSFDATLDDVLANGTVVANQATISAGSGITNPAATDDPATPALDDPTAVTVVSQAVVSGTKTVTDENGGVAAPGDIFLYTLTFTNTGDDVAPSVSVTDQLDPNLTFVEVLDGGTFNAATQTVSWNLTSVQPGVPLVRRFRAAADSPLANGTPISNQGTFVVSGFPAAFVTDDPTTPAPDDPTVIVVVAAPDLTASTKTVAGAGPGGIVSPGVTLTYTITVENTGDAIATGVVVTDVVDVARLDQIMPLDGGMFDAAASTITWSPGAVVPGVSATVRFTARVRFDAPDGAIINNQGAVSSTQTPAPVLTDDPLDAPVDDPTEVVVEATPTLVVTKTVEDLNGLPAAPGDVLEWSVTVDAAPPIHAFNVTVTDIVTSPFLTAITPLDGGVAVGSTITWTAGGLAHITPGTPVTVRFRTTIEAETPDGSVIENQASVGASGLTGPTVSDDPATPVVGDPTTVVVVAAPVVVADKTIVDQNGGTVQPGDILVYTITVGNEGTASALDAQIWDPIPALTTYVQGSTRLDGTTIPDLTGGLPPLGSPDTAGFINVFVGETRTVEFRVRVNNDVLAGSIISNQAVVEVPDEGQVLSDDPTTAVAGDATQVVVGGGAMLTAVTKSFDPVPVGDDGDGLFEANEIIQYRVTVENNGDVVTPRAIFTDELPAGTSWVAGSLRLNGAFVSDTIDGDAGELASGELTVRLGDLAPGQIATVDFRVRVTSAASGVISNQGAVDTDATPAEPTDADGNDGNGDQPTLTPVGEGLPLAIAKSVSDLDGGVVAQGDTLLYTLSVTNVGTRRYTDLTAVDLLPELTTFVPNSITPAGTFEPGVGPRGNIRIAIPRIDAGETLIFTYRVTIDGGEEAGEGASICNDFQVTTPTTPAVTSEEICVVVGNYPGMARLEGRAYIEDKVKDRVYTPDQDDPFANLSLQLYRKDETRSAIAGVITAEDGRYVMNGVPPGEYTIRAFSTRGVQLASVGRVAALPGDLTEQDVWIDPSGRVYDATTARFIQDVQVFLFYDEEDPTAPGQLVPASRLGPGQQGQVTPAEGVYRFDVADAGRKYRIQVDPGPSRWAFPSQLIPPTPGFAPAGNVVDDNAPSLDPNSVRTYFLRFDLAEPGDDVFNNHIPLDPLSTQVRLDKRADRPDASLGDIVNYTITVQNRSSRDLTAASGQPVWVLDAPARGLSYLRGKAAAQVQRGRDADRMIVGRGFQELITTAASGQLVKFGPFDVPAGGTLTLTYQVVVGLDTRQGTYTNRAVLVSDGGTELSNSDTVALRVKNDPIFDEGTLVGRVFCDKDGDGRLDRGERGILGARVYIDTGSYAKTDLDGKWHLSAIDPGVHVVKLDTATLPAGSKLTTEESQTIYFTRGLGMRVNFAATCASTSVAATEEGVGSIKLSGKTKGIERPKPPKPPKLSTTITGDLATLAVAADGAPVVMPVAELRLEVEASLLLPPPAEASEPNLVPPPEPGWNGGSPVFKTSYTAEDPARSHTLSIWRVEPTGDKTLVREVKGQGAPPADWIWDGKGDDGKVVARDRVYVAQLYVVGEKGEAASRRLSFGVAFGLPPAPEIVDTLRGDFFTASAKKPKAKKALTNQIKALAGRVGPEDQVTIEVHHDGTGARLPTMARTQKQADVVKDLLVKAGIPAERIKTRGRGSLEPVAGTKTKKDKAQNRRLVVKITPPPPAAAGAAVPPPAPGTDDVLVAAEAALVDETGRFVKNVATPADGRILVDIATADGRRSVRVIEVPPPEGATVTPPAAKGELEVSFAGDLQTGAVTVAGAPLDTALLQVDAGIAMTARTVEPNYTIKQPPRRRRGRRAPAAPAKAALDRPIVFDLVVPPAIEGARWELVVLQDQKVIWRQSGDGAPLPNLSWTGEDDSGKMILTSGARYQYRLVVEDTRGGRVETPLRAFTVGVGKKGGLPRLEASGKLFNKKGDPGASLKNTVSKLAAALKKRPAGETYRIDLRILPPRDSNAKLEVAKRVGKLKAFIAKLKVPPERVEIVTEIVEETAPKKQRKDAVKITAVPPATGAPPRVAIGGEELAISGDTFSHTATIGADGVLVLDVVIASGQHATFVFPAAKLRELMSGAPAPATQPATPAPAPATQPQSGVVDPDGLMKPGESSADRKPASDGEILAPSEVIGELDVAGERPPGEKITLDGASTESGTVAAPVLDQRPAITLSLADDKNEFGGEALENAIADPDSLQQPRDERAKGAGAALGRLITDASTGARIEVPPEVLAADLTVDLPPRGLRVRSQDLWVRGKTNAKNKVKINGREIGVRKDGTFDELVALPPGKSTLKVEAIDPDDNIATIAWPIEVTESEHFLLVLADGAISSAASSDGGWSADGAALDGMTEHSSFAAGHVLLHGRVALYYKGRMKGGDLFNQVKVTAHVDTAKQPEFEEFFGSTLDPTRDYAVYGDESEEVRDANARGKLYVLVEADDSKALVGNFKTTLQGGELFRYDRTVYGAQVDFKKSFGAVKQEVKVFGTTGDGRLARDVNLFRATGGSLYYLRHGRVVEGGERVRIVVRDRDNGLVLSERAVARDLDYAIDYAGGRIMFREPIASTADSAFLIDNLDSSATPLDGHPVYVEVTYEYEADDTESGMAGGVYVRDTLFDTIAIGAGIVGESRDDEGTLDDYGLIGADLTWKPRKRTLIRAELAQSQSSDAGNYISMDGGLSFQGLNAVGITTESAGRGAHVAWKLELDTELGDFARQEFLEATRVRLYAQKLDRGFFSGGSILEQGRTKYGGQLTFRINANQTVTLKHDAEIAEVPRVGPTPETVMANPDPLALDERASYTTAVQWLLSQKRADFKLEAMRQSLSTTASLVDQSVQAVDTTRYGLAGQIGYKATKWATIRLGQEIQWLDAGVTTDPVLSPLPHSAMDRDYDNRMAGVATSLGVDLRLAKDVFLSTTGIARWNGDTAAQIGLKTPIGDSASMYITERFEDRSGKLISTSIVGGEERFGATNGGKAYGEYQLESGMLGVRNRAVLGVGHRWSVARGLNIAAGFEHQQTFGGYLPDGTPIGGAQRDVLHFGTELVRPRKLKASATVEVRFDDGFHNSGASASNAVSPRYEDLITDDPRGVTPTGTFPDHGGTAPGAPLVIPPGERIQVVAGATADWKWTEDQTFLARFRLSHTEDITNARHELPAGQELPEGVAETYTMARFVEATAGWAYRPLQLDWLDILLKYSFLMDQRPFGLNGQRVENVSHVASVNPIVDLPMNLYVSGKLAWKRSTSEAELIEDQVLSSTVDAMLWLTRVGWRFHGRWDVAGEYRMLRLWKPEGGETRHGFLVEVDYNVTKMIRLGVGYNFSRFSDDELGDLERDTHGLFFRVVGRY